MRTKTGMTAEQIDEAACRQFMAEGTPLVEHGWYGVREWYRQRRRDELLRRARWLVPVGSLVFDPPLLAMVERHARAIQAAQDREPFEVQARLLAECPPSETELLRQLSSTALAWLREANGPSDT